MINNNYKNAFELSPYGIAIINKQAKFIDVNNEFCNLVGYTKNELLNISFLDITHPDDVELDKQHMSNLISGDVSEVRIKKKYIHKNGTYLDIFVGVKASFKNGKFQNFVCVFQDLQKDSLLLSSIDYNYNDHNELRDFAYIASHDLKSPLRSVSNYLFLIFDRLNCECVSNDPKILDYKDKVDLSIKSMNNLISDLLSLATATNIDDRETNKPINLNSFIHNCFNCNFKSYGNLIVEGDSNFIASEVKLSQVFSNLFSNSVKYKNNDFDCLIKINIQDLSDKVYIEFSDNGIGIEEKYFNDIFKPFKRLHKNSEYEGTGIGLFICKKIINANGGSIEIKSSKVGVGTTFSIVWKK